MSCCKPGYREVVNEKEEEINEKGKDTLPLSVKVIAFLIIAGVLALTVTKIV